MTASATAATPEIATCRVCRTDAPRIGEKNSYPIHRCPACGFLFADGDATDADPTEAYHAYGGNAGYLAKKEAKLRRNGFRVFRYGWLAKGKRFLDVGCNVGTAVEAARRRGYDAMGIDVDADAVRIAKETFPDCRFEARLVQDLAATGAKFDFIFNQEVIEHVPDPIEVMVALRTLLAPGGKIWMTTPDAGHRSVPSDPVAWPVLAPPDHIGMFTRKSLGEAAQRAGLKLFFVEPNPKGGLKVLLKAA